MIITFTDSNSAETQLKSINSKHNILLWNTCSLNKQINTFQSFIYSNDFDIIAQKLGSLIIFILTK